MPVAANLSYTFNGLTPVSITERAPYTSETHVHDGGVYAQDRWTIDRLTLNLGVRWDFIRTSYPRRRWDPPSIPRIGTLPSPPATWRASMT